MLNYLLAWCCYLYTNKSINITLTYMIDIMLSYLYVIKKKSVEVQCALREESFYFCELDVNKLS